MTTSPWRLGHTRRMLRVVIRQVQPGRTEELRAWLAQAGGPRRQEALDTLADEGCAHEMAFLIEGKDGPVVVYAMEVEDERKVMEAFSSSRHQIDAEHKQVMEGTLGANVHSEVLLNLHR
jgi:hypothetical protein